MNRGEEIIPTSQSDYDLTGHYPLIFISDLVKTTIRVICTRDHSAFTLKKSNENESAYQPYAYILERDNGKNILVNRQPRAADCEICLTHDERKASLQAPELDPMHFNSSDCADHTRKISLPWHRFQIFWRHDREFIGHILRIDKNRFIDASNSARSGSNNSTVFKYLQMYTILMYVLSCTIYKKENI